MNRLKYGELISPFPIKIDGVGYIIPPKYKDIMNYGYDNYQNLLLSLIPDLNYSLEMLNLSESYNNLPVEEKEQFKHFDLFINLYDPNRRNQLDILIECLSFFLQGSLSYDDKAECITVLSEDKKELVGSINRDNFDDVRCAILDLNCILPTPPKKKVLKFKNEKAKEIFFKVNGNFEEEECNKPNPDINIPNIISALSCRSHSYNMTNIWSLTIYQLYDQFFRQILEEQFDISKEFYAAALSAGCNMNDDFDSTLWFKSLNETEEK